LLQGITRQLQAMQKDGSIKRIENEVLASLEEDVKPELRLVANESSATGAVSAAILKQVFLHTGFKLVVATLPAARATVQEREGILDGDVARIADYGKSKPELVRVEPAYYALQTVAFAKSDSKVQIKNSGDLKNYRVGIVHGLLHAANATTGVKNITEAGNSERLFAMLEAGRSDVAVDSAMSGASALKKLEIKDVSVKKILSTQELFLYLHSKHKDMVPAIGLAIQKLKNSGELARIIDAVEKESKVGAATQP